MAALLHHWIMHPQAQGFHRFDLFRVETSFPEDVVGLSLRVSAHNHLNLLLNGVRVTGFVTPAPSTIPATKLVLAYELDPREYRDTTTPDRLCLAAETLYLGLRGQNYIDGVPAFALAMELRRADGTVDTLSTAADWRCCPDPPYESGTPAQQNRRMSPVVVRDARKLADDWMHPGFDDGDWMPAVPAAREVDSWGQSLQRIPEGAVHALIPTRPCGRQEPGCQVFDAGFVVTGFPVLTTVMPRDTRIRIRYSEDLRSDGLVGRNVCNETSETYYDEYVARGTGTPEVFRPDFTYKAFRFLEVTGFRGLLPDDALQVAWTSTGLRRTAWFHCPDPSVEQLFEACMTTQRNNIVGLVSDCPHREQAQYLADSENQFDLLEYGFSDTLALLGKVLRDFADAQHADGTFPFVAPCSQQAEEFQLIIPEYDLRFVRLCHRLWRLSGNAGDAAPFLPSARRMLYRYEAYLDGTGLMARTPYWHIGDWPYPTLDDDVPHPTPANLLLHDAYRRMAELEAACGDATLATIWTRKASSLHAAIRRHLWDPLEGLYRDGSGSAAHNSGISALAMECGLVPEAERAALRDRMMAHPLDGSVILMRPWLHTLFQGEERHRRAAYDRMTRPDVPGWGRMVQQGWKTIWEGFEDRESHSHAWNAYPARMLLEYVAGIRWTGRGEDVAVDPWLPPGLDFVEAEVMTPAGPVKVTALRDPRTGELHIDRTLPPRPATGKD